MEKKCAFLLLVIYDLRYFVICENLLSFFHLTFVYHDSDYYDMFLQANFPSLESLVAKIHEDRRIAENALELPIYSKYKDDHYLKSLLEMDTTCSSH